MGNDKAALGPLLRVDSMDEAGFHIGKHTIPRGPNVSPERFLNDFIREQTALGGTPEQLKVLAEVRDGKFEGPGAPKDPAAAATLAAIPVGAFTTLAARANYFSKPHHQRDQGDTAAVILNGADRQGSAVDVKGQLLRTIDAGHGMTAVQYVVGGRLQTLAFETSIGVDAAGMPIPHPLRDLHHAPDLTPFSARIDARAENFAVKRDAGDGYMLDQRFGPDAVAVFGPPKPDLVKHGSPELEHAIQPDGIPDAAGYHIGTHVIPRGPRGNDAMYLREFQDGQRALGGTPLQLAILERVRTGNFEGLAMSPQIRAVLDAVPDGDRGTLAAAMDARMSLPPRLVPGQLSVTVNGAEKHRGVDLSGEVTGVDHLDNGATLVQYASGGRLQTLEIGRNAKDLDGNQIPHPLGGLSDVVPGDQISLKIDGSGTNAGFSITDNDMRTDRRVGADAVRLYGPERQIDPRVVAPDLTPSR